MKICIVMVSALLSLEVHASSLSEADIYRKLESLSSMRVALASQIKPDRNAINEETFQSTCLPVGKELKRWASENKLEARQISRKNRNHTAALSAIEDKIYQKFVDDPGLQRWTEKPKDKSEPFHYFARITTDESCLVCHGQKDKRPAFILNKYPSDKAYDFHSGDLRGVYKVTVKTVTAQ